MRPLPPLILLAMVLSALASPTRGEQPPAPDPKAVFKEADTNGDGAIDLEEFHQRIVEVFYRIDANKDGFLSVEEFAQLPYPEGFQEADRDGDGKISLHEFVRIRFLQFEKADTNHDGELSLEEVVAVYEGRKKP